MVRSQFIICQTDGVAKHPICVACFVAGIGGSGGIAAQNTAREIAVVESACVATHPSSKKLSVPEFFRRQPQFKTNFSFNDSLHAAKRMLHIKGTRSPTRTPLTLDINRIGRGNMHIWQVYIL